MKNKYCNNGYPSDGMAAEDNIEMVRLTKDFFGDLDPEEKADFCFQARERRLFRKENALKSAQVLLRRAQRPVRHMDMLTAMDNAIMHQVSNYERLDSVPNAVLLVATVICKNLLIDGPLHEEA